MIILFTKGPFLYPCPPRLPSSCNRATFTSVFSTNKYVFAFYSCIYVRPLPHRAGHVIIIIITFEREALEWEHLGSSISSMAEDKIIALAHSTVSLCREKRNYIIIIICGKYIYVHIWVLNIKRYVAFVIGLKVWKLHFKFLTFHHCPCVELKGFIIWRRQVGKHFYSGTTCSPNRPIVLQFFDVLGINIAYLKFMCLFIVKATLFSCKSNSPLRSSGKSRNT